jgi:hypothetical protein
MATPWRTSSVASVIGHSIMLALMALAFTNLLRFRELPKITTGASVIWISLNVWYVWMTVSMEGGFRRWGIARLGQFGRRHFVWIDRTDGGSPRVSVGFRAMGRRFFYHSYPATDLHKVNWNFGQASAMSRQEMADWSTTMWFHPTEPKDNGWTDFYRGQCSFGFQREKARIAEFGESLVKFLKRAGLEFEPLADGCGYRVITPASGEGHDTNMPGD